MKYHRCSDSSGCSFVGGEDGVREAAYEYGGRLIARPWLSLQVVAVSTVSVPPSGVCGEEGVEVVGQGLRLVDGDEGSAVVDPHQLGVLEVVG